MSNTQTLTDKTLANRHIVDVLNEQTGNLTQRHRSARPKVYKLLSQVARRAIQCALAKPVARPDLTDKNWHTDFANDVADALINAGLEHDVKGYVQKFQRTFPKKVGSMAKHEWGYIKIASYAGQCATMMLYGLNPDLLSMSDEEIHEEEMQLLEVAQRHNIPTIVIALPK